MINLLVEPIFPPVGHADALFVETRDLFLLEHSSSELLFICYHFIQYCLAR